MINQTAIDAIKNLVEHAEMDRQDLELSIDVLIVNAWLESLPQWSDDCAADLAERDRRIAELEDELGALKAQLATADR